MRYLCCACNKQFPSIEAIDGFDQGYRRGFLCPHCRANLGGHFDLGGWLHGEGQPLSAILAICLLATLASFRTHLTIPLPGLSIPLWGLLAVAAGSIGVVLAFRTPHVLLDPLMHTKRIEDKGPAP